MSNGRLGTRHQQDRQRRTILPRRWRRLLSPAAQQGKRDAPGVGWLTGESCVSLADADARSASFGAVGMRGESRLDRTGAAVLPSPPAAAFFIS